MGGKGPPPIRGTMQFAFGAIQCQNTHLLTCERWNLYLNNSMNIPRFSLPALPRRKDFQYQDIQPHDLPRVMTRHIVTGAMGTIYGNLTMPTGMFVVAFGNIIGVSITQWGVLSAACSFALMIQLVAAYWSTRLGYRRLMWFLLESASRLIRGAGIALAFGLFLWGYPVVAAWILILLMGIGMLFSAGGNVPWMSWLADIIPEKVHGSFMGRRDAWIAVATICLCVPLGLFYDIIPEPLRLHGLTVILGIGVLMGMIDLFLHRMIPEPRMIPRRDGVFWRQVINPLRNTEFRNWLLFVVAYNFALFLGSALSNVYFVENLQLRNNLLGGSIVLIAVPLLGTMLVSRWSGKLIDRVGVRQVLLVSYFFLTIFPLCWIVATPRTALFWLTIASFVNGGATVVATNAANKLVLRLPAHGERGMYVALNNFMINIAAGSASLIAGYFLAWQHHAHWSFWIKEGTAFELLFTISIALRGGAWLLLLPMKNPAFDAQKKLVRRINSSGAVE